MYVLAGQQHIQAKPPVADATLRKAAGAAVLLVAAIAAAISYAHIYSLALQLGQPKMAAWLMPLSVDGAVGAASAALLSAARAGQRSHWPARTILGLGVLATLVANAYSGSAHGLPGMVLAMWPAVAFIGSTEVALGMTRHAVSNEPAASEAAATVRDVEPADIMTVTATGRPGLSLAWPRPTVPVITADKSPVMQADTTRTRTRTAARTPKPSKAAAIVKRQPDISGAELGRKLGVSERQGRRILADITEGTVAA
jgi:hypothetical protein